MNKSLIFAASALALAAAPASAQLLGNVGGSVGGVVNGALDGPLNGAGALDSFFTAIDTPLVKFAEFGLVAALAVHLAARSMALAPSRTR